MMTPKQLAVDLRTAYEARDRDAFERGLQRLADGDTSNQRPTWRCYFCDEVFTTPGGAADHFGATLADKPGCLIDFQVQVEAGVNTQRGRGLLMELRRVQAELAGYREEDTDLHRALHAKDGEHATALQREEEKGYARGLRDAWKYPKDAGYQLVPAGVTVTVGSLAPKPPCTVCGTLYEKHGSYPTCASHPYTADDKCQHVGFLVGSAFTGAPCAGAECKNGCVLARGGQGSGDAQP